jgi:glycosyltransferase involved in cell wall biosynthesis
MKILQVCPRYYPYIGGLETHVKEISERLAKKGLEVEIWTTDPFGTLPKEDMIGNLKIKRFRSWAPNEAYYFSKDLKKCLAKNTGRFDIVHAHGYHAFPALYAAQTKSKNKLIFTPHYHGKGHTFFRNLLHIPYRFLAKRLLEKADRIICVSNYEKGLLTQNFRVKEEKILTIPNGLNLKEFKGLRKQKKDYRTILCVARLEKYKGIDFLIKVLPKLENDMRLEIVGKGPYGNKLAKLIDKLGVRDRVIFFQELSREELLQRYASADLFALLSRHEAYGISVGEALASKTPCIVSNKSALKEWIDNENCFGIDYPIDLDELAELIDKVIGKKVGELNLPDWDENVEKLFKVYKSV